MACQGLTPTCTKLVFSENVVELAHHVQTVAMQMGLISRKGKQEKSITFYHKSVQEKLAGEYLAEHPDELTSYLKSVNSVRDAQQIGQVLIAASASSHKAFEYVLRKLMNIFDTEKLQYKAMSHYMKKEEFISDFDEFRRIQQYFELVLECNFEADAKARFTKAICRLFPYGEVYCFGIQPYAAVSLGYFLTYCANIHTNVTGLTLHPIMHSSEPLSAPLPLIHLFKTSDKTMKCLDDSKVQAICQEFKKRHRDTLHSRWRRDLEKLPRDMLACIQCAQACEGLAPCYETNIEPIINGLKHVKLQRLNTGHFQLGRNFGVILKSIERGYMGHLQMLSLASIGAPAHEMTCLTTLLPKMPHLWSLDISHNENLEPGKTISALAEYIKTSHLKLLQVQRMVAQANDTEVLSRNLENASQLTHLHMDGNWMSDKAATHLIQYVPKQLNFLSISVDVSVSKHRELLLSFRRLKHLQTLQVYHSPYPSDLVECVASILLSCAQMEELMLEDNIIGSTSIVKHEAWTRMADAMKKHKKLRKLYFRNISLKVDDFEELISISKKKKYEIVR